MRPLFLVLLVLSATLAGCASPPESAVDASSAPTKEDAGARAGLAPRAPDAAYRVNATAATVGAEAPGDVTAYPLKLRTNPARAPLTIEKTGEFTPLDCSPTGSLPTGSGWHSFEIDEGLEVSDVFRYDISLTFENSDQAWAEIRLFYRIGASRMPDDQEATAEKRGPVTINYTGQGYRADPEDPAWAAVACWYGLGTAPIPYSLRVTYTFAENAVPSETPLLVTVPDDARRLLVTGVPLNDAEGVVSHFRVFGPDDSLLCACVLGSDAEAATLDLDEAGAYVVLVDHTSGGFVALALDAPSPEPLLALDLVWERMPLLEADGTGAVEEETTVELPTTPLLLGAWYGPPTSEPSAGGGRNTAITITNDRGEVFRAKASGFATARTENSWSWYAVPLPGEWDWYSEHHNYANGAHTAALSAEWCRCEFFLWYQTYARI